MLFGWLPRDPAAPTAPVLAFMRRSLLVTSRQRTAVWNENGFGIGAFDVTPLDRETSVSLEPADAGNRYRLWMVGEAFGWPSHGGVTAPASREPAFRRRLLESILRDGAAALRDLDGEYHIAIWDRMERSVVLMNDRFGALPMYWVLTPEGMAFAGGVRGVLMAPGARVEPDCDAIRDAVTFGGFRLGTRTNVRGVSMLPGASALASDGITAQSSRYWRWADLPQLPLREIDDVVTDVRAEWRRAIAARVESAGRVGMTLSGGLDSRAILAEAVRHVPVHAITYGVPESDDVRIARRAAGAAGARWTLYTLYSGPDWLERRASHIQATDGLMDLVDLMHLESVEMLASVADVNLSGYIGDAVTGPTFSWVHTPDDVAVALPYYGGILGLDWPSAVQRVTRLVADVAPASARFVLFEHKLPQSTNRITAALRPYVRVRRPFVDYHLFELAQGQPNVIRSERALHDRWLRSTYPICCARIPHQKTGVPPMAPAWRRHLTRAVRHGWRTGLTVLQGAGLPVVPPRRSFHNDETYWRTPSARERIEGTILRPDSLSAELFGRERLRAVVGGWFDRLDAPTQVIGALFVFEHYHRDLAQTLRDARAACREELCSSASR